MKSTQNEKISQIKITTLVVGIDVAKETHYARALVQFNAIRIRTPGKRIPCCWKRISISYSKLLRMQENSTKLHPMIK